MIRWLLRTISRLTLLAAVATFGNELYQAASGPGYRIIPLGKLWASLNANSLIGLQAAIEGTSTWLWRTIVLPILLGPAWAIPLGVSLVLFLFAGRARRRADPAYGRAIAGVTRALRQHASARRAARPANAAPAEARSPDVAVPPAPRSDSRPGREPTIIRRP